MKRYNKRHYRLLIVFMVVLCSLAISLTILTVYRAERIHAKQTYDEIYSIKKSFLKDTVQNMMRNIDRLRDYFRKTAEEDKTALLGELESVYTRSPGQFRVRALTLLQNGKFQESLNIRFEEVESNRLLFRTAGEPSALHGDIANEHRFGAYRLLITVNDDWVDDSAKQGISSIIREQAFENGGYIWVNEVLDWGGGDRYAIRRIHPNLKNTEGDSLSTETRDIKGNLPYLEELEGVRDSGEIFYTYFFKRPGNDRIAEKISYATQYKDFGWIIAMGVYLEDVQTYIDSVAASSRLLRRRVIFLTISLLLLLFSIALFVLSKMEKGYLSRTSRVILEESNLDPLTGVFNRRMGDQYLSDTYKQFRRGIEDSALLLFDIDDFKVANDLYGHKAGDLVLKAIVRRIRQNMRTSDHLIRWGGEEFLLLCYGIAHADARQLAEKLRAAIENMSTPINTFGEREEYFQATVSFGVSWFLPEDKGPEDALLRADRALYRAKSVGKNCVREQEID